MLQGVLPAKDSARPGGCSYSSGQETHGVCILVAQHSQWCSCTVLRSPAFQCSVASNPDETVTGQDVTCCL